MLLFRRLPGRWALPQWWLAAWVAGLPVVSALLVIEQARRQRVASDIEWPMHNESPCLGGDLQVFMFPLVSPPELSNALFYLPPRRLEAVRQWHTVRFVGAGLPDFLALEQTAGLLRALAADTCYLEGVRIRFYGRASYSALLEVLYSLRKGEHKYWLSVRREPLTIYVVTLPPRLLPAH